MYAYLSHELVVEQNWKQIFQICQNVDGWSDFMPAVKAARFITQTPISDTVQITAKANDELWTWQSERILDEENRIIRFRRLSPPTPISYMKGAWEFTPLDNKHSILCLTHEFELFNTDEEKFNFITRSIKQNARTDLKAIQKRAIRPL